MVLIGLRITCGYLHLMERDYLVHLFQYYYFLLSQYLSFNRWILHMNIQSHVAAEMDDYVNKMNLQELSAWVSTNHFFFFLLISSSCSPFFSSFVFFLFLQPSSFSTWISFSFISLSWPWMWTTDWNVSVKKTKFEDSSDSRKCYLRSLLWRETWHSLIGNGNSTVTVSCIFFHCLPFPSQNCCCFTWTCSGRAYI